MDKQLVDQRTDRDDGGFTLIETLIVVVVMGLIVTAIAGTIVVVLRTSPPTEVRAEDARSVQGLVTWLPQDIDAAPPDGFNRDHGYWPCGGTAPAESYNILTSEWTETMVNVRSFAATYRYERKGDNWYMVRYFCEDNTSGVMGAAERINLTSQLPEWNSTTPPAWVSMCRTFVDAGAACPSGDIVPGSDMSPSEVHSLKLHIKRIDGAAATIDAAPKNPDQDLANDPNASPNLNPTLSKVDHTLQMYAGQTVTFDVTNSAFHGASDPDGDPISVALDSTEPLPAGITVTTADPTIVNITADPSMTNGVKSPKVILIVSDNNAGWVDALVTVEIIPEVNAAPTFTTNPYHLIVEQGDTVVLPLDSTHGLTDPNGDTMAVTVTGHPASFVSPPKIISTGPLDLEVKVPGGATLGVTPNPIDLTVDDGRGGTVNLTITVEIVAATPNQTPTATTPTINVDMYPGDSLPVDVVTDHGVSDPDGDPLSIVDMSGPAGLTLTANGALGATIAADPSLPVGPMPSPVRFEIEDIHGEEVEVFVQVNILEIPPAPSDCVLGSLTASPNSVERHSNGNNAHQLKQDVTVTVTWTGTCDGLALKYDTGDTSGLGIGTGRVFIGGSPSSIVIVGKSNGGTEKWKKGTYTLTVETTSAVTPNSRTTTLTVD